MQAHALPEGLTAAGRGLLAGCLDAMRQAGQLKSIREGFPILSNEGGQSPPTRVIAEAVACSAGTSQVAPDPILLIWSWRACSCHCVAVVIFVTYDSQLGHHVVKGTSQAYRTASSWRSSISKTRALHAPSCLASEALMI